MMASPDPAVQQAANNHAGIPPGQAPVASMYKSVALRIGVPMYAAISAILAVVYSARLLLGYTRDYGGDHLAETPPSYEEATRLAGYFDSDRMMYLGGSPRWKDWTEGEFSCDTVSSNGLFCRQWSTFRHDGNPDEESLSGTCACTSPAASDNTTMQFCEAWGCEEVRYEQQEHKALAALYGSSANPNPAATPIQINQAGAASGGALPYPASPGGDGADRFGASPWQQSPTQQGAMVTGKAHDRNPAEEQMQPYPFSSMGGTYQSQPPAYSSLSRPGQASMPMMTEPQVSLPGSPGSYTASYGGRGFNTNIDTSSGPAGSSSGGPQATNYDYNSGPVFRTGVNGGTS